MTVTYFPPKPIPVAPMTEELWQAFEVFLALEHTGRVIFHVERGVVRMVETTAIIRPTRANNNDRKLADPVESS